MRRLAAQWTTLPTVSPYLNKCLVIAIAIGLPVAAPSQPYGKSTAGVPKSALAPAESCPANHSALEIQNTIPELVSSGRWHELELAGGQLVHTCPDNDLGYHWLGVSYLRQGRSFAAVRAFEDSLRRHEDAGAHLFLAEAYYELGQKRFFWEEIDHAKEMAPQESGVYYLAGLFCFQAEQANEKAASWFRMALDKNPRHVLARCYLALCLRAMQQYKDAETTLLKAVDTTLPANAQAVTPLQLLVSLELEMNQPANAMSYARMAAQIAPNSAKVQLSLGKASWATHDQATALAAFKAACKLDPESAEPHYLLSRVYMAQGQDQLAQQEITTFKHLRQLYHGSFE